jgi:hypothetical protein
MHTPSVRSRRRDVAVKRIGDHVWGCLLLLVGAYTLVVPGLHGLTDIPGDLGDARFNMYVLEHFLRFATGQTPSFWDAPFFYPYPLTTAFSVNHLGDAPVYAAFRLTGFDRETSFQLWYLAGYATSFLSAYYVLVRARMGRAAAALGAFIFAFGLPALAQQNHAQLIWRAGIPLASWWMWRFVQLGNPRVLFLAVLAAVWQLYAEIYMGVMLALLLIAMLAAGVFALPGGISSAPLYGRRLAMMISTRRALPWTIGAALLILAGAALLVPYVEVFRHYGFQRGASEVQTMLPQWRSYLLSDQSILWGEVSAKIQGVTMRWEHQLFIGIAPVILLALSFFVRPLPPSHRLIRVSMIALALLVLFTIHVHNFSIYKFALAIPGLSAIRGVTRIIEVMLWPVALLTAAATTRLLAQPARWMKAVAAGLMLLTCFESVTARQFSAPKNDAQARIRDLKAAIASAPAIQRSPILFVSIKAGQDPGLIELDAMLASQDLGWPTLNGYSGSTPPGYASTDVCSDAMRRLEMAAGLGGAKSPVDVQALADRVLPIGFANCPPELAQSK